MERIIGWEAASKVAAQSVAQLRRLVESGKLRASKDRKGRHVFRPTDLDAVRKPAPPPRAPASASSGPPTAPAAPAGPAAGHGTAPETCEAGAAPDAAGQRTPFAMGAREELSGEVTAAVFAELEKRVSPVRIAIDRRLSSGTVRRAVEEWRRLHGLDLSGPSVPAAVDALRRQVRKLAAAVKDAAERIGEAEAALEALPLPDKRKYACEKCGTTGKIAVTIECTECGDKDLYGFFPAEQDDDQTDGDGAG